MVTGVVEDQHHAAVATLMAQQVAEEALEGLGVEHRAHHAYELAGAQADRAEAGHGLASRRMLQDGVLDFGRYPHAAPGSVLLEVTFIQTPQFDVRAARQTAQFFLPPRLSADRTGQPGDRGGFGISDTGISGSCAGRHNRRDEIHEEAET